MQIHNTLSKKCEFEIGVPQGTVLSTILFSTHDNHLFSIIASAYSAMW